MLITFSGKNYSGIADRPYCLIRCGKNNREKGESVSAGETALIVKPDRSGKTRNVVFAGVVAAMFFLSVYVFYSLFGNLQTESGTLQIDVYTVERVPIHAVFEATANGELRGYTAPLPEPGTVTGLRVTVAFERPKPIRLRFFSVSLHGCCGVPIRPVGVNSSSEAFHWSTQNIDRHVEDGMVYYRPKDIEAWMETRFSPEKKVEAVAVALHIETHRSFVRWLKDFFSSP